MEETRRALRRVIPVLLLLAAVLTAYGVARLDWRALGEAAGRASLWPWLPLAVAAYLSGQVARGARGRVLVGRQANVSLAAMTNIVAIGYAGNNLLPARLGELARMAMLSERTGFPLAQSLAVIVIDRLFDAAAIVGLFLLLGAGAPPRWVVPMLVAGAVAAALGSARARLIVPVVVEATGGNAIAIRSAAGVAATLSSLRSVDVLARLTLLTVVVWLCESAMYLALLPAVGLPARFATALAVMAATNIGLWFAVPAGFLGVFHAACAGALQRLVGDAPAAAYATLAHAAFYLPVTVWGASAFAWALLDRGWPLYWRWRTRAHGAVAAQIQVIAPLRPAPPDRDAPPWLHAIVESLLEGAMELADRAAIARRVASFSHAQLRALPPLPRHAFFFGMFVFRAGALLRHGRSLTRLPPAQRAALVARWNDGRAKLRRQLFRPLRATALLAFYEQPEVCARLDALPVLELGKRQP